MGVNFLLLCARLQYVETWMIVVFTYLLTCVLILLWSGHVYLCNVMLNWKIAEMLILSGGTLFEYGVSLIYSLFSHFGWSLVVMLFGWIRVRIFYSGKVEICQEMYTNLFGLTIIYWPISTPSSPLLIFCFWEQPFVYLLRNPQNYYSNLYAIKKKTFLYEYIIYGDVIHPPPPPAPLIRRSLLT